MHVWQVASEYPESAREFKRRVATLDPDRNDLVAWWDGEQDECLAAIELARDRGLHVEVFRTPAVKDPIFPETPIFPAKTPSRRSVY